MKAYLLVTLSICLFIVTLSSYYLLGLNKSETETVIAQVAEWKIKDKEIRSRLLSAPILLYHNIDGGGIYSISEDVLRSHFQLLKDRNIKVIRLSKLTAMLAQPEPFNDKVVVITFDDGFLSMYTKLLPLVREFGYPISLFVYTDNVYSRAKRSITWKNLREMEDSGIEIECHSMSHADLEVLSKENTANSKRRLFKEIYLSKRILELYMQKKIRYFAFPFGRYDLNLIKMCRFSGYSRVFSTDYGSNIITRNNYCLRRGHIKRNYSLEFIEQKVK